jgi:dolichol-phosphate mannosyltransferase
MPSTNTLDRDSLVIVPTYNEAETLNRLVPAVLGQETSVRFNLLVVDDNSPDGTGDVAERLSSAWAGRLAVVHRESKLGLGSAYVVGFRHALELGYKHIFEMDADLSHDPAALPVLRSALDRTDIVLGSRYVEGGEAPGWSTWRHALSFFGSIYAGVVLGLPVHDLTSGFKGFRASVLQALDLDAIRCDGYAFQIEVTYQAYLRGFRVVEQPISFGPRLGGRSKMGLDIILEALWAVWWLRFNSRSSPQKSCRRRPVD